MAVTQSVSYSVTESRTRWPIGPQPEASAKNYSERKQYMKSLGTLSVLSHHMKMIKYIIIEGMMQGNFLLLTFRAWVKNEGER